MAKREAGDRPVRSRGEASEVPPTMLLAAEEHAKALKVQLLESTELAAQAMLDETRVEGDRRIEGATRQAEAIATTVSEIENAERTLTERARTFAAASKALRAELESFAATLSDGERRLQSGGGDKPEPRLVTSEVFAEVDEADEGGRAGDPADADEVDDLPQSGSEVSAAEYELAEKDEDEDEDEEDDDDDGVQADDDEDDRPTPEQFARLFGESEEAGSERPYDDSEEDVSPQRRKRGERSERMKRFFMGPERTAGTEAGKPPDVMPAVDAMRYSRRDKLAAELGGALIGLGGTVALLRFVLLD